MLKKEAEGFLAYLDNEELGRVDFPCLLYGLCGAPKPVETENATEQMRKRLCGTFSLVSDISIPSAMLGYRGVVLSLCGLLGHCAVFCEGEKLAEWRSPPARIYLPIEKREGVFRLEIRFFARELPSDVGVLGGVELIAYSHDLITDIYTEQVHKGEKCELFVRVKTLRGLGDEEAMVTVGAPGGELHYLGLLNGEGRIQLPLPHKYRPLGAGHGGLYRLSATLYADGNPVDTAETSVGLRKITFPKDGAAPFAVMVDGEPLFIKAARTSAVPSLSAQESLSCFERALPAFVKMGGNALFVTAERGILPEQVYSLCDRLGLLVFQQLPAPSDPSGDLGAYFADLKASLSPLVNHPSLALILLPDGVLAQDSLGLSIKGFFAFSFPCLSVRSVPTAGFPDIARVASMPSSLAVRRSLPMEARRIFSYAMESAQESKDQIVSMLGTAAAELPYGASLEDVCYVTTVSSAEHAQRALASVLERDVPGGILGGTLFEGGISMRPALMDGILQKKALYFDLQRTFAPVFLDLKAEGEQAEVSLATSESEEVTVRVQTRLMDRFNNCIRAYAEDVVISPGARLLLKTAVPEVRSHEREYYLHVSVSRDGAPIGEKTALFVPAKHFRFGYPNLQYELKGSGKNYELTLSAAAYVRRLQIAFSKTAASLSKNYFDITSDAKIIVLIETEEVTTSRYLETQLRLRSVYDVGRISEQDYLDAADIDP